MLRRIALLYVSVMLAFFVAPLGSYLASIGRLPIRPLVVFVAGFTPVLILAFLRWVRGGMRIGDPSDLVSSNSQLLIAFAFVAIVALLWTIAPEVDADGYELAALRVYGLINVVAGLAVAGCGLRENELRTVLLPALGVMLATMYADVLQPGTFSVDGYRAAGVAQNSNVAGFTVVLIAAASLTYERVRMTDLALLAACGMGVVWTSSRAAILLFCFVFAFWCQRSFSLGTLRRRAPLLGIVTLAVIVVLVAIVSYSVRMGDAYQWFVSRQRTIFAVDGPETLLWSVDRMRCARYSLDALPGHWVLGHGTGFTRTLEMGPHNMLLEQWVSNGLPGLLGLCWLVGVGLASAARRRSSTALATMLVIALQCFFSHNLLDERAPLLVIGLVMGASASAARSRVAVPRGAMVPDRLQAATQPA